ncbi:MAG: cobyrinate a,c-diamide synthase [Methanoregulaceae archaeon]|nr:cobyrinate a,c-diamide synthase [Methanoregulaceae archaeon]
MHHIPRIVIAGTHSGCGKTTISRGLMQAFRKKGLIVQPFKVGPDFIDPSHHTAITGRISRNLDPFMMGEEGVIRTFLKASEGADIAVIEGVMGMYDGIDGSDAASTAHVMRIIRAPAILVVDATGMSRSAHAVIKGFCSFEPELDIRGVIFNRVGSQRHRAMIGEDLPLPASGFIPRDTGLSVESRHLGLKMAFEVSDSIPPLDLVGESCDIEAILGAARSASPFPGEDVSDECPEERVRIGIAQDSAFCFYYQDNLDALRTAGAALVPFSPCADPLPEADAYYLGGGYPELHAQALSSSPCRVMLKAAADRGVPVYGECGGLLYLTESVFVEGHEYPMTGILPANARMTGRIQALGYSEGVFTSGPHLAVPGDSLRGHEFHYSTLDSSADARFSVQLTRGKGIEGGKDGLYAHETIGVYTHSYFTRRFAAAMVDAAFRYRKS